jgi:hypothetical protein
VGTLPPTEGRLLYMACVDPHLIGTGDVFIDIDDALLLKLADVQHVFLSCLLHVNEHSILDPCSQN